MGGDEGGEAEDFFGVSGGKEQMLEITLLDVQVGTRKGLFDGLPQFGRAAEAGALFQKLIVGLSLSE